MSGYGLILKVSDISVKNILFHSSTIQLKDYSIATFPMHCFLSKARCFDFC